MRFKVRPSSSQLGQKRVVRKFLFLPKTLNEEIRWLELSEIEQQVMGISMMGEPPHAPFKWIDINWADNETLQEKNGNITL